MYPLKLPACLLVAISMICIRLTKSFSIETRLHRTFSRRSRPSYPHFSTTSGNDVSQRRQKAKNTGGLRRLPVVKSPVELVNRARREAQNVKADRSVFSSVSFRFTWLPLTCHAVLVSTRIVTLKMPAIERENTRRKPSTL